MRRVQLHQSIWANGCMHPSIFRPDTTFRLFCPIFPNNGQILHPSIEISNQGTEMCCMTIYNLGWNWILGFIPRWYNLVFEHFVCASSWRCAQDFCFKSNSWHISKIISAQREQQTQNDWKYSTKLFQQEFKIRRPLETFLGYSRTYVLATFKVEHV